MAERTFIPNSPACGQWETLLADALDGLLKPEDEVTFNAHMAVCPACRRSLRRRAGAANGWSSSRPSRRCRPGCWRDSGGHRSGTGAGLWLATAGGNVLPFRPDDSRPGLAASRFDGARAAFCRTPPDDDGRNGLLFNRHDAEPDRRPALATCGFLTCGPARCARSWSGG
jgi:hypothetical protein